VADVCFGLSAAINLAPMVPAGAGTTALPAALQRHSAGIYLIRNHSYQPENRYMGITIDFQFRFAGRQAVCFELGLTQANLQNIDVFIGRVFHRDAGALLWNQVVAYGPGAPPPIPLDGFNYDFEHLFIKSAQHAFVGTITNTQKVGVLQNRSGQHAINVQITWNNAWGNHGWGGVNRAAVTIAAGGQLA
jgi:hypothetical protein